MKADKYSKISIALSLICIGVIIYVNYKIYIHYLSAYGKTKAFFGITESIDYFYKYYFVLISIISLIFAIKGKIKREMKSLNLISFLLSLLSILIIFLRIWIIMV